MNTEKTFLLPRLNKNLKLYDALPAEDGSPKWTIHNPITNTYFQIGWIEFECLSRFHKHKDALSLKKDIESETTLKVSLEDLKDLVLFLIYNNLVSSGNNEDLEFKNKSKEKEKQWWIKAIMHYLFFTLPLFRPQSFLDKTYPYIQPLLSKNTIVVCSILFLLGLILTLNRSDEFFGTIGQFFSVEGIILSLIVFGFIKIVHELSHAYMATKYNVPVPHMGIAFIVLYPVLYTETTAAWRIADKNKRMHIGLAGIMAELCLASVFLILWHIFPPGIGQSICFAVITISLVGSLFINLNPLMRFDGYYILSDFLNIENLQARSTAFARWRLREILFGLEHDSPEVVTAQKKRFLTIFGTALIIYRFFLFIGIAILVYMLFFKPLGFILMCIELAFFIGLPILKELQIWWSLRRDIFKSKRSKVSLAILCAIAVILVIPSNQTVIVPAIAHYTQEQEFYAPSPSYIEKIHVKNGDNVEEGSLLAVLTSRDLEHKIQQNQERLKSLETLKRSNFSLPGSASDRRKSVEERIAETKKELETLEQQKAKLIVRAPFSGTIQNFGQSIHQGRFISSSELLFILIDGKEKIYTAYVSERDLGRISKGNSAKFKPDYSFFKIADLHLYSFETVASDSISKLALTSSFGGPITSEIIQDPGRQEVIKPLQSQYKLIFKPVEHSSMTFTRKGTIYIEGKRSSPFMSFIRSTIGLIIRESGLNA